jgi:hypothetical protein
MRTALINLLFAVLSIVVLAIMLGACAASAAVMVASYGAKGDGATDDAPAFQKALASGQEVHVPRGTYALRTTINLTAGMTLIGEDNPTLLVGPQPTFVVNSVYDWITVTGFTINGQNQGANVFTFSPNTYEVRINNCIIENAHSAFVQGGGPCGAIYCNGDEMAQMSGSSWVFTGGGSGLWVTDCTVIPNVSGQTAMYCIGYGGVFVRDYNQYEYPNVAKVGGWAFQFYNCYSMQFDGVLLDGLSSGGFLFSNCFNITGANITCWGLYGTGIEMILTQRAAFTGLISNYSQSGSGVVLDGCSMTTFAGSQLVGNATCGAVLTGGSAVNAFSGTVLNYNAAAGFCQDAGLNNTLQ